MLAYKRINNEKGLINIPNSSIGANIIFIGTGTPGIQKICFQYVFLAVNVVIKNVNIAKEAVIAIFPVTLTPSGVNPKIFKNHTTFNHYIQNFFEANSQTKCIFHIFIETLQIVSSMFSLQTSM